MLGVFFCLKHSAIKSCGLVAVLSGIVADRNQATDSVDTAVRYSGLA